MRYFAKVEQNLVIDVILIDDSETPEGLGLEGNWVETWQNGGIRKNYASVGYSYDSGLDAFIAPKLNDNYVFDSETASWIPPVPKPTDGKEYVWDFEIDEWVELNILPLTE